MVSQSVSQSVCLSVIPLVSYSVCYIIILSISQSAKLPVGQFTAQRSNRSSIICPISHQPYPQSANKIDLFHRERLVVGKCLMLHPIQGNDILQLRAVFLFSGTQPYTDSTDFHYTRDTNFV